MMNRVFKTTIVKYYNATIINNENNRFINVIFNFQTLSLYWIERIFCYKLFDKTIS